MPFERVAHTLVRPAPAFHFGRVPTDVRHVQVEQAIVVVVEEDGARRMSYVVDARGLRDVFEVAAAVVLEQHVATANGRYEEILIAVVVDVGKRGRHANPIGERDTCFGGDVPELAAAEIFPELV